MSTFVLGIPVPEGLDPKIYRARVIIDRADGAELTPQDLARIDAVYPNEPEKRHAEPASNASVRKAKTKAKPGRAA